MKKQRIYALYYGDKFIDLGTKNYLANLLNVNLRTIDFYKSPIHLKRSNYESYIVIEIKGE